MTQAEVNSISNIYNQFFSKHNCQNLFFFLGKWSAIDCLIQSASTVSIVTEYKNRDCYIFDFDTCLLELDKYNSLKDLSHKLDSQGFYLVEYKDIILIYHLDFKQPYEIYILPCQHSQTNLKKKDKDCILLHYSDATYIISKKTYNAGTIEQLNSYIKMKKEQNQNEMQLIINSINN
jgi:hypothetical protein